MCAGDYRRVAPRFKGEAFAKVRTARCATQQARQQLIITCCSKSHSCELLCFVVLSSTTPVPLNGAHVACHARFQTLCHSATAWSLLQLSQQLGRQAQFMLGQQAA